MAAVLFSALLAIQDMKLFTQLDTGLGFTCESGGHEFFTTRISLNRKFYEIYLNFARF
jgi:hypothetical protein